MMQWAEGMKSRGYDAGIITGRTVEPHEDLTTYTARTGVSVTVLDSLRRELEPKQDLKALLSLRKLIRREKPQIIHTNSSKGGIIGRIAARMNRTPVIVHSPHGHIFYGYYGKVKTSAFIRMERWAARFTDRITNLTGPGREDHIRLRIAAPDKFIVIPAGIDLEKFSNSARSRSEVRSELGLTDNAVVVGWVGRMADIKNPMLLIETAALLKGREDLRFLMVGAGDRYDSVRRRVEALGLSEKFRFTGHREDVPDLLAAMDIYILTSSNEGLGRSILEAQAAGLPVIATDVGGVPEIIEDGVSGLLIPPSQAQSAAEAVLKLADNVALRGKIVSGANSRLQIFSLEKTLDEIDNLYQEMLSL